MKFIMVKPRAATTQAQRRARRLDARRTETYSELAAALCHTLEYVRDPRNRDGLHVALDRRLDAAAEQRRECAALWPEEYRNA